MNAVLSRVSAFVFAFVLVAAPRAASAQVSPGEDWGSSAEAYFMTSEEKAEWRALTSRESRQGFIERYWLKRDPTPGTEKNEFQDAVRARIRTADKRFPIQDTPGSLTRRGMVFIVFGSPARVRDTAPSPLPSPRPPTAGSIGAPVGFTEGTESSAVWTYDRERTPRLLEALGNRPSLDITFVVDPSRHRDEIQTPGLVEEYREVLARKSIVNPDLVASRTASRSVSTRAELPNDRLPASAVAMLGTARAAARGSDDSVFGHAVLWGEGAPKTTVWFYLPAAGSGIEMHGRFVGEDGTEVAAVSETAAPSADFSLSTPKGLVVRRTFALPPGNYSAAFAVDAREFKTAASATVRVPDLTGVAVSSLLLSSGASRAEGAAPFALGKFRVAPRADAVFLRSESLWYFLEVAGVADPKSVTLETRLRRGTETVAASDAFPAGLVQVAPGRYVCGFEIPLATLPAGDYVLYVNVRTGAAPPVLRRGDFQVREAGPTG